MPGRSFNGGNYRYGFDGQENDNDIAGVNGANTTAEFWEYDSRLGRRWNIDPVIKPSESSYNTFANDPIYFSDIDGADPAPNDKGDQDKTPEGGNKNNTTGEWETHKNGGYSGIPADPKDLPEVTIEGKKSSPNSGNTTPNGQPNSDKPVTPPSPDKTTPPSPDKTAPPPSPDKTAPPSNDVPRTTPAYNGSLVAKFALSCDKKFKRGHLGSDIRPINYNPTVGKTMFDCSGFVSYCFDKCNYATLKKITAGDTYSIVAYAQKGHGGLHKDNPKVGDLALWDGHVEVVISVSGKSFVTIGSCHKDGALAPDQKHFSSSDDPQLKCYGSGTFLGFWTPQVSIPVKN